jgi:glycosyltransferase involved in cell wall biosynthesis
MTNRREKSKQLFQIKEVRRRGIGIAIPSLVRAPINLNHSYSTDVESCNEPAPPTNILIKLASRGRPDKLTKCVNDYLSNLSGLHDVRILVSLDLDDDTTIHWKHPDPRVIIKRGNSKSKIEAINADMQNELFDVLINASDDMLPVCKGYDDMIARDMFKHWPNYDGCLLYFEGSRYDISTLSIMGYNFYSKFNYIYYPKYKSFYCDDEYTAVGRMLRRMINVRAVPIMHFHPDLGMTEFDDLYKANNLHAQYDSNLFANRRAGKTASGLPFDQPPILLSLLIPTLYKRKDFLDRLLASLNDQINRHPNKNEIEIVICKDNKELSIGEKRNILLTRALGEYVAYIDDDDQVSENYVEATVSALKNNPGVDCCSLSGIYTINGKNPRYFYHDLKYDKWFEKNNEFFRCPNHLNAVKRSIALEVGFPGVNIYEDRDYSTRLKEKLHTQAEIKEVLYFYDSREVKND